MNMPKRVHVLVIGASIGPEVYAFTSKKEALRCLDDYVITRWGMDMRGDDGGIPELPGAAQDRIEMYFSKSTLDAEYWLESVPVQEVFKAKVFRRRR